MRLFAQFVSGRNRPVKTKATQGFRGDLLAILLVAAPFLATSLRAVEGPPNPGGSEITFEWDYSCPTGRACSFSCPGSGGASSVTKLSIYLGTSVKKSYHHSRL